ncbi:Hypothetical protein CINCED_3A016052 [Cinara cedri]|uniref:Tc1-like transposase DDE domain-containing protein n=1 Tax=Cinara cedri TaxID=506608 RepID=A0A5E4MDU9_9HEMI|nr:Hypothetical protein CINCED_3A016052 [Cinara cedri]
MLNKMSIRLDVHSQTKNTIFNVYNFFKKLANDKNNPVVATFFRKSQEMTAEACGVSVGTVKRITSEGAKSTTAEPGADETWVNTEGLKVPTGKGSRIIICHAGSSAFGFLKEAKLIFRCKSEANIDFHTQMNSTIFKKWFIEMMQNLEEPCVIVMDNCPYHSVLVQNYPKSNDNKATLQKWFTENGMESASFETLIELRERVKLLKQKDKRYEIDEIALQMGHEVIRLPPYHYQYNPIELIWAQVKGEIAKKNNSFKITDVEKLANIAIESVTVDNWKRCVNHCERLQDEDFIKEGFRDKILEPIVLTINPEDSSESDDDDESLQF